MGFFSKIGKGIKSAFKKIGKGIKSAFKKFGKFMGKIGILGQVAMFFIMPYVGAALGGMFTGAAGALATNTVGGALGAVGQAAGKVMQFVGNTVGKAGTAFNNITQGVTDTLGNFAKTASNKMFGTTFEASANFFGAGDSAFNRSFGENSRFQNLTSDNVFFEDIKKSRQVQLDRKTMNTLDEVVSESSSNFNLPEAGKRPPITDEMIAEESNYYTASVDVDDYMRDPSQTRLDITDPAAFVEGMEVNPNFKPPILEAPTVVQNPSLLGTTRDTGLAETLRNAESTNVFTKGANQLDPSLFDRLKTGISEAPANIYKKAGEIADDPLGFAFKGTEKSLQQQMNLRVGQELGISAKPEYVQNYVSNNAYVPSFESFGGSQQQYGAPEIMNARSFEQQVTNNPSPYGYTAFQYGNYMAQFAQTA